MEQLEVLTASMARLRRIVEGLAPDRLTASAYPSEWSIADTLSHLGSGAVIMQCRIEAAVTGTEVPGEVAPRIWDEWNAKPPAAQAADSLLADDAFLDRVRSLTSAEQADFRSQIGPMAFDLAGFLDLRVNEHVLHTWDVEVAIERDATLPLAAAALVVGGLSMLARYTGRPDGSSRSVVVRTSAPARSFEITFAPDSVALAATDQNRSSDLDLPAEAFVRLVYGRLDPEHTPPIIDDGPVLAALRATFPGP